MKLTKRHMDLATQSFGPMLIIGSIGILVIGSLVYGIYVTFGAGAENLTDQMEEHARLHAGAVSSAPQFLRHVDDMRAWPHQSQSVRAPPLPGVLHAERGRG